MTPDRWTYKGINIYRHGRNSMGLRWYALSPWGFLRSDSKESMRGLITETMAEHEFNYRKR